MVDEVALVEHLKQNPMFRVGLDVFEVTELNFSVSIFVDESETTIKSCMIVLQFFCIRMNLT